MTPMTTAVAVVLVVAFLALEVLTAAVCSYRLFEAGGADRGVTHLGHWSGWR
jgi:hypothetical protein